MEDAYKLYVKEVLRLLKKHELGGSAPDDEEEIIEEIGLTYHPGGLPKVPEEKCNIHGTETNHIRQGLIRDYMNKHYELASGRKAKTQFINIANDPTCFIEQEFWPSGVVFKEPSKYSSAETNKILVHWRTKQMKNEIPFRFKRVPIGNSVEPEHYPAEIFNISSSPPPPPRQPIKTKPKRTTMRDHSDSDDSEGYNSQLDDEQELDGEYESEGDRPSSVMPPTPPDSDKSAEPSVMDEFSDSMPSSPMKKTRKQKVKKLRSAVAKAKIGSTPTPAVTKKKKGKVAAPPPQRLTCAKNAQDTPPTQGTRSKTTSKPKGRK